MWDMQRQQTGLDTCACEPGLNLLGYLVKPTTTSCHCKIMLDLSQHEQMTTVDVVLLSRRVCRMQPHRFALQTGTAKLACSCELPSLIELPLGGDCPNTCGSGRRTTITHATVGIAFAALTRLLPARPLAPPLSRGAFPKVSHKTESLPRTSSPTGTDRTPTKNAPEKIGLLCHKPDFSLPRLVPPAKPTRSTIHSGSKFPVYCRSAGSLWLCYTGLLSDKFAEH